jgi:hypothetical protein
MKLLKDKGYSKSIFFFLTKKKKKIIYATR